jgi:hypothetical protein
MSEEQASTTTETTEATAEETSVETQSVETQSTEQVDTTQQESVVTSAMGIEAPEESETSSESGLPSIDDIVAEVMTGEVSEETQRIIEENGLGKHLDMLVQGHVAIQEKNNQEVFDVVGGEQSYAEMQEWGKHNMSTEQQEAFNEALFSGNMALAKLAVQGLQAQYVAANGKSPDRVIAGGGSVNDANRPFNNPNEYIQAYQSLEYKNNPEYRQEVERKRNLSGF